MTLTLTETADLMSKMKRSEVPECWLKPEDIVNHRIEELLQEEIDFEEFTN